MINNRHADDCLVVLVSDPVSCDTDALISHLLSDIHANQTITVMERETAAPQEVAQLLTAWCIRICNTSQLDVLFIGHHC